MSDKNVILKFFRSKAPIKSKLSACPTITLKVWKSAFSGKGIRKRGSSLLLISATLELSRRSKELQR